MTPDPIPADQLDLTDIQGNLLRGYHAARATHYLLSVNDARKASAFLGRMVAGNGGLPPVTTAAPWTDRPTCFVNVGVTAAGLRALEVPDDVVAAFPEAFRNGPTRTEQQRGVIGTRERKVAEELGDVGPSDPAGWRFGGPANCPVHLVVSVYTGGRGQGGDEDGRTMAACDGVLREAFTGHALAVGAAQTAQALAGGTVHFGYRDGIGQPRIAGAPGPVPTDMQPTARPGEFLLGGGHVNQNGGNFIGDLPPALCDNGTFGALRMMAQDVAAFERFIVEAGRRANLGPELVAAKLMGRWRNGTPLTLAPNDPHADLADDALNAFDFAPSAARPAYYDDDEGLRCPVGSHMRRMNPRGALVQGRPHSRRVVRRGLPYGPPYEPGSGSEDEERGLIGYFLCGDLESQFEFVLGTWANRDFATTGLQGTTDPFVGQQPEHGGRFVIRTADGRDPIVLDGLPQLVRTRGTVYTFLPGIGGLRYLAERRWP